MKTIICLIRHGQTDWNKKYLIQGTINNPLNETGKKQANDTANLLKEINLDWDVLITSPLIRAKETMEIIRDSLYPNKEIIIDNQFIEREFGELEGMKVTDETYKIMSSGSAKGLESLENLKNRSVNALINIAKKYPNKKILITSHSQFIKGALIKIDDGVDFTYPLKNTSLNFIKCNNDTLSILKYNVTTKEEYNEIKGV